MTARFAGYDDTGLIGILVPDQRIRTGRLRPNDGTTGNSDYTERGIRPGVPEYDRAEVAEASATAGTLGPSMALETTGTQEVESYHVKVLQGGMPGDRASVIYRPTLDDSERYRGWQTHNVLKWVNVDHQISSGRTPGTTGQASSRNYACCTAHDGTVVIAIEANTLGVSVYRYDPDANTVAGPTTALDVGFPPGDLSDDTSSYSYSSQNHDPIDLLVLPSGRILLYYLARELSSGAVTAKMTLMVAYSDDNGASWRTANYLGLRTLLGGASSDKYNKLRAAYSAGNVLLTIEYNWEAGDWGLIQLASDDGGLNFLQVEDWQDGSERGRYHDTVVDSATGVVTVLYYDTTATQMVYRRIANPFSAISSARSRTFPSSDDPTHLIAYADTDGILYCTWDDVEDISVARSYDGGATWGLLQRDLFDSGDVNDHITDWDITVAQGDAVWIVNDPDSNYLGLGGASAFMIVHAGGWDGICQPRVLQTEPFELEGFGTGVTWLPTQLPDQFNWTPTGAGTATLNNSTAPFGVNIACTSNQYYYEDTRTIDATNGFVGFWSYQLNSGGSLSFGHSAVQVQIEASGTLEWGCEVRFVGTQVRMVSTVGGATIATANVDTTTRKVFKLAMRWWNQAATTASATLYVREPMEHEWTTLISTEVGLVQRVVGTSSSYVRWGGLSGASTSNADWHFFCFGLHAGNTGDQVGSALNAYYDDLSLDVLQAGPFALYGAPLPALPYKRWVEDGLYVHGTAGPAYRGDTWRIEPAYDYPVGHLDLQTISSPRRPWRSASDGSAMTIAWEPSGHDTQFGGGSTGLALFGCNIPEAEYRGWNGASWVTLSELDFTGGMTGLAYVRNGDSIFVNVGTSTSGPMWIAYNELVGCTVDLGSGKLRKVVANTEGSWTHKNTKRPVLTLDGIDGTEPSSGTLDIWYREAVAVLHDHLIAYDRYCLYIPSTSTADGYYQVGAVAMGHLAVFANKHSQNRVIATAPNAELVTATDGVRTARTLGPSRRTIQASWVEGVDSTPIWESPPAPDYVAARAGTEPIGARGDLTLLEGLVDRQGGSTVPVVYLPRVPEPPSSGDTQGQTQLAGRERVVLGRLTSAVSREVALGHEVKDEVYRLTGFVLEEEV